MLTRSRILLAISVALSLATITGCRKESSGLPPLTPQSEDLSAADATKLVKIGDAPNVCPSQICPVGTRLYYSSGRFCGDVIESSLTMKFPSGNVLPGMNLKNPRLVPVLRDIPNSKNLCVLSQ